MLGHAQTRFYNILRVSDFQHAVFLLPAPYIAYDFISVLLQRHPEKRFTFIIKKDNVYFQKLTGLASVNDAESNINIIQIASYELKGSPFSWLSSIMKINKIVRNIKDVDICFLQSLQPFYARTLYARIKNASNHIRIVGLQLSIPTLLFRNPRFLIDQVRDEKVKKIILSNVLTFQKTLVRKTPKEILKRYCDWILSSWFTKQISCNNFIDNTSYVNRNIVDLHIVNHSYYEFLIREFYNEPIWNSNTHIDEISDEPTVKNGAVFNNIECAHRLTILGPTSLDMIQDYEKDLASLTKVNEYRQIIIRPHPRFTDIAENLRSALVALRCCKDIQLGDGDLDRDDLLGYFSSLLIDIPDRSNRKIFVSTRATSRRYPMCTIDLLSGGAFGFSFSFTKI